ncbi:hypothetical protein PCANC_10284 [Puccinia coronata f. sp. avenae]|uniref:Uncharacterized protein n=1 Tax=Puccinia coronata f. sp. avenae TaxID=200324 RepID=A0A2N5VQA8_9BASI|nr:hypothetical protein PCANC_10284 [Puccinia coronata f. sp. avenae]
MNAPGAMGHKRSDHGANPVFVTPLKPKSTLPASVALNILADQIIDNALSRSATGAVTTYMSLLDPNGPMLACVREMSACVRKMIQQVEQLTADILVLERKAMKANKSQTSLASPGQQSGPSLAASTSDLQASCASYVLPGSYKYIGATSDACDLSHISDRLRPLSPLLQALCDALGLGALGGMGVESLSSQDPELGDSSLFIEALLPTCELELKPIHYRLEATRRTFSVIAHYVPKHFDPDASSNLRRIEADNDFSEGDLVHVEWLVHNTLITTKRAGSVVLSFKNKHTAEKCEEKGVIFLCYGHRPISKYHHRPPRMFRTLGWPEEIDPIHHASSKVPRFFKKTRLDS